MSDCGDYGADDYESWNIFNAKKYVQSYNRSLIRAKKRANKEAQQQALFHGIWDYLSTLVGQCPDLNVVSTKLEIVQMLTPPCEPMDPATFDYINQGRWLILAKRLNKLDSQPAIVEQVLVCVEVLVWEWPDVGTLMLPIKSLVKLPLSKLENFVLNLITRTETENNMRYFFREKTLLPHSNLCALLQEVLKVHRDLLAQSTLDRMFHYCTNLIWQYQNETMVRITIGTFVKFPSCKLNSSLCHLMDSMELDLNKDQCKWFRHQIMGNVIEEMLKVHRDSLEDKVLEQLFDYLIRLVLHFEEGKELIGIFSQFPLSKLQSSVSELVCSMNDKLESKQCTEWLKHDKIVRVIVEILKVHRDSLDNKTIDQLFGYCTKLMLKCEDAREIIDVFLAIPKFPLCKLESSLPNLMHSMDEEMQSEQYCHWFRHQNMGFVIRQVLKVHSLGHMFIDEMFDYCSKVIHHCDKPELISHIFRAFRQFSLNKLDSSLPKMIDLMECELQSEQCKWFRHQNMSNVIESVLSAHRESVRDGLSKTVIDQMLQYLTKLILKSEDGKLISCVSVAFVSFPFDKLESSMLKLTNLMENQLEARSLEDSDWHEHNNFGHVIAQTLDLFQEPQQQLIIERIFEYLAKLILNCRDVKLILYSICAFSKFSLSKLESSLTQLICSREDELQSEQCTTTEWFRHENMCAVIEQVLTAHRAALHQTVIDHMFDYCGKVILKCNENQILFCFMAFAKFPLSKLESSLPKMIQSLTNKLQTGKSKWYLHYYMSWVIKEVLRAYRDSLNEAIINQMFEYLSYLIFLCENDDKISYSFEALGEFPFSKLCHLLPIITECLKNQLKSESLLSKLTRPMMCQVKVEQSTINWNTHNNMCTTIEQVLKAHRDALPSAFIDLMFDYLVKLMYKCEDGHLIENSFGTFKHFPVDKLNRSLPKLMKSFKIDAPQSKWYRRDYMLFVIVNVLEEHRNSLDQTVVDRMFEYCARLKQIEALEIIKQKTETM